ncbi:MAG: hypothetical protein HPY66_1737 [Firmicutes bacterium]|nr:hypothetical protein [Bacillota bacterium]
MRVDREGYRLSFVLDEDEKERYQKVLDKKYKHIRDLLDKQAASVEAKLEQRLSKFERTIK